MTSLEILYAKSDSDSTSLVAVVSIVLTSALIPSIVKSGFFFQSLRLGSIFMI